MSETLQKIKPDISLFTGAEDWVEFGLFVEWDSDWDKLSERFELAKKIAGEEKSNPESSRIAVRGRYLKVSPNGGKVGEGRKGFVYPYKFECESVHFMMLKKPTHNQKIPNAIVRVTGEPCLEYGGLERHEFSKKLIRQMGGSIEGILLSRVDICLDLPGIPIDEFSKAFSEFRYVTKVKKIRSAGMPKRQILGTFYFGAPPLQVRIYDKLAEVKEKANPARTLLMQERRWNGIIPACATRVEFEVRRAALKKRGIDTVDDYIKKRADLIRYLTHDWIRLTETVPDSENRNQHRAKTLNEWKLVQAGFQQFTGEPIGESLAPLDKSKANVTGLLKQSVGVAITAGKMQGRNLQTMEDVVSYLLERKGALYGVFDKRKYD